MFKYDFGELGVRPMRVNHKLSPSQGWDGEPCLSGMLPYGYAIQISA